MNSALRSLIPAKARRWVFIGGAVLMVIGGIVGFVFGTEAILVAFVVGLACIVALAAAWVLIWYLMRNSRRKRQRQFDAGIAAREGIDDRKREWQSWVTELEKNQIDRYELPFYLLVGEPQSGKSVLLQNSDLKFLFGQSRLSGVGGTRGCDWWFTEEAVILDLAGRLFTHEGGAADEAEWEAFLDLLNTFRPLDPANGIMLVIPCDSLLGESLETCGHKASKTREALLSLTRKLEAKLPIYVVLTKGDKIFGFAETVHRLPIEQRHQMFGWSRSAERLEEPFEPTELREAWDGIVRRGTVVRDRMLATARLPEALPEVDRMLGFPEELKGLYEPLETYLKRIFQGSELVEQLYFRGIYLTSGLQSGAPIAKVCLDILDRPGEADNRDLEKLFIRQQSYFIKDLVRKRVFAERGLVKPTSARVERAKRTAWGGYGLAASLAVISLIWGIVEIRSYYKASGQTEYQEVIDEAARWTPKNREAFRQEDAEQPRITSLLATLDRVQEARDKKPRAFQRLHVSRQSTFARLYESIYDDVYRTRLQSLAAERLAAATSGYLLEDTSKRPADHAEFLKEARAARALGRGITSPESARRIAAVIGGDFELEDVVKAHEERGDDFEPIPAQVKQATARINGLWNATLDPADPIHVPGSVGFCLAWKGMSDFAERAAELAGETPPAGGYAQEFHDTCARATRMLDILDGFAKGDSFELSKAEIIGFQNLDELAQLRVDLLGEGAPAWEEKASVVEWMKENRLGLQLLADDIAPSVPSANLPPELLAYRKNTDLRRVVSADLLGPNCLDNPATLATQFSDCLELARSGNAYVQDVARIKLRLARIAIEAEFATWESLHVRLRADRLPSLSTQVETQRRILEILEELGEPTTDLSPLVSHLDSITVAGVAAIKTSLVGSSLEIGAIEVLHGTRVRAKDPADASSAVIRTHLLTVRQEMLKRWGELAERWPRGPEGATGPVTPDAQIVARDALAHIAALDTLFASETDPVDTGRDAWLQDTIRVLTQRLETYQTVIRTAIESRVDLSEAKDLTEACRKVREELIGDGTDHQKLNGWKDTLHATHVVPRHDDADLVRFFALEESEGAREKFSRYCRLAQFSTGFPSDSPQELMRKHVASFLSKDEAMSGTDLAEHYSQRTAGLEDLTDNASPHHGIQREFSLALSESFDRAVRRQLQEDYLAELEEKIVDEAKDQVGVFWHNRGTPAGKKNKHHDAIEDLFADDGRYLRLLDRYHVFDLENGFRVGAETIDSSELPSTVRNKWKLDVFLQEMLLYVREVEQLSDLSKTERTKNALDELEKFTMTLEAAADSDDFADTWFNWGSFESDLFTDGVESSIQNPKNGDIIETLDVDSWAFNKQQTFDLTWIDKSDKATKYERKSCLEPLLLFWGDRETTLRGERTAQKQSADVDFLVMEPDKRAPFQLKIVPAPPRRPSSPDELFGN